MSKKFIVASLAALAFAVTANARELQMLGNGIKVDPVRIASVQIVNGEYVVGEWQDYVGSPNAGLNCAADSYAYDAFEEDDLGAPTNGESCGLGGPSYRWFYGPSYVNLNATNDNQNEPGSGGDSLATSYGWYWYCTGSGTEQCVIFVFTGATWDACTGFADGFDGVAYDFGDLTCNPGGYYYTNVNLDGSGLFHTLGEWHQIRYRTANGDSPASGAQPMLWGPDDAFTGKDNAGATDASEWDDDAPADDSYAPEECYDLAFGICPDPLGAMINFCSGTSLCPGDEPVINKAKCATKNGAVKKVVVKFKNASANTDYTVSLDSGQSAVVNSGDKGKGAAKFKGNDGVPCGANAAHVCGASRDFVCSC